MLSLLSTHSPGQKVKTKETSSETDLLELILGPKLNEVIKLVLPEKRPSAKRIYPYKGSSTCCHGLFEDGFLIGIGILDLRHLIVSGIIRSLDQSPHPITFPALALAINLLVDEPQKLSRHELIAISAAALLLL